MRESQSEPAVTEPPAVRIHHNGEVHIAQYHAGETLLETARRAGVRLAFNCERGECGTCIVTVLRGAVKMRANEVLSEQDLRDGLALGCQSIPITEVMEIEIP
jgi:ferredoxin